MKRWFQLFYMTGRQIVLLIRISRGFSRIPVIGKILSVLTDNLLLFLYGMEVTSSSLDIDELVVGHSVGVVLGGNGIRCRGKLLVSSGVVFGRRYGKTDEDQQVPFFDIDGDVTIGANSVLLGPLKIKGPTVIGAMTLVTKDIMQAGVYVGVPANRIDNN